MRVSGTLRSGAARLRGRSPVLTAVMTLLSGTLAAQVIGFVLQIGIARTYSATDKGLFGIYGSVASLVVTVAAARFDLSVVLPRDDDGARVLVRLASRCIVVSSLLTSLACVAAASWVSSRYGSAELAAWLCGSGVTVFALAQAANLQYWLTRKGRFGDIARSSVVRSLAVAGLQLVCGWAAGGGLNALIGATVVGQLIALAYVWGRGRDARAPGGPGAPTMGEMARRYRRMALLGGPNVLVDAVRNTGINLLIGSAAVASLGQFQLAWAVLQVPVALIVGSIGQVFLRTLSRTEPGRMGALVAVTMRRAVLGAALPFGALYALAPWLFPVVFGAQWDQAGDFARSLVPWLAMMVVSSPVSNLFVVTDNQHRMLAFAVVYCAAPLAWLWLSPLDLAATVRVLGAGMAALLVVMVAMAWACAREFDRCGGLARGDGQPDNGGQGPSGGEGAPARLEGAAHGGAGESPRGPEAPAEGAPGGSPRCPGGPDDGGAAPGGGER